MLARGGTEIPARLPSDGTSVSGLENVHRSNAYPVVDLFAGPGGLGEGFASALDEKGKHRFRSTVSIERDKFSHRTLLLRHFVRHFPDGEAPDDYYEFLAGRITDTELFNRHPAAYLEAKQSALRISLGADSHAMVRQLRPAVCMCW